MAIRYNPFTGDLIIIPVATDGDKIPSNPPAGKCKVTNIFVNPENKRMGYSWENIPEE